MYESLEKNQMLQLSFEHEKSHVKDGGKLQAAGKGRSTKANGLQRNSGRSFRPLLSNCTCSVDKDRPISEPSIFRTNHFQGHPLSGSFIIDLTLL